MYITIALQTTSEKNDTLIGLKKKKKSINPSYFTRDLQY